MVRQNKPSDRRTASLPAHTLHDAGILRKITEEEGPGECTVSITVDINGNPHDAHIIKSVPDNNDKKLRDAVIDMQNKCIEAAKQFRFEPALYKGKPVPVEQTIETIFPFFN